VKRYDIFGIGLLQIAFIVFYLLLIVFSGAKAGLMIGLGISLLPIVFVFLIRISTHPYWIFVTIFVVNYYIMGLTRYVESLKGGVTIDVLFGVALFSLIVNGILKNVPIYWRRANNPTTYLFLIWFIFCSFEAFNPSNISTEAWFNGVRPMAWYCFIVVLITQLLCKNYKQMRSIIMIMSVLALTALIKMYIQHCYGFDSYEWRWLVVSNGIRTHIVNGVIRYFSFFTDSANFGCNMAFMFLIFMFAGFGENNKWLKYYYIILSLGCLIGMLYSGTRVAVVIPFVGIGCFILLDKNWKNVIIASIAFAMLFCFFRFTNIGEGNSIIRRTRTAFKPNVDPSWQVRKDNQAKLKKYMHGKNFGAGIGSIGGNAPEYAPDAFLSQIPADTWLVMVWVDTGIIGITLYISIFIIVFIYEGWIILFKLKNKTLRYYTIGMYGGVAGMLVASYGNQIFSQFPNGFIIYMCIGFIAISPHFDKELEEQEKLKNKKLVKESTDNPNTTDNQPRQLTQ
jgi:hypothetical protein